MEPISAFRTGARTVRQSAHPVGNVLAQLAQCRHVNGKRAGDSYRSDFPTPPTTGPSPQRQSSPGCGGRAPDRTFTLDCFSATQSLELLPPGVAQYFGLKLDGRLYAHFVEEEVPSAIGPVQTGDPALDGPLNAPFPPSRGRTVHFLADRLGSRAVELHERSVPAGGTCEGGRPAI